MARGEIGNEINDQEVVHDFDQAFQKHCFRWQRVSEYRLFYVCEKLKMELEPLEVLREVYPDQITLTSWNPDWTKYKAQPVPHMEFSNQFMVCVLLLKQRKRLTSEYKLQLLQQLDDFIDGSSEYERPLSHRQSASLIPYDGLNFHDVFKKAPNFWDVGYSYFKENGKEKVVALKANSNDSA